MCVCERVSVYVCVPAERALACKEDGNEYFKKKQYKKAIAAYTAGLKEKVGESELTAVLYCNRAAAHYHLSQYATFTTTPTPYSLNEVIYL